MSSKIEALIPVEKIAGSRVSDDKKHIQILVSIPNNPPLCLAYPHAVVPALQRALDDRMKDLAEQGKVVTPTRRATSVKFKWKRGSTMGEIQFGLSTKQLVAVEALREVPLNFVQQVPALTTPASGKH